MTCCKDSVVSIDKQSMWIIVDNAAIDEGDGIWVPRSIGTELWLIE
jgi:hypothetical protein